MKISITAARAAYGRAGFIHSHPDGGPVLKEHASWRTITGVYLTVGRRRVWLDLRRVAP